MIPQFAWMYFLDVITSPVAWAAFGLGCIVTAGSVLAGLWFGRNGARHRYLAATRPLSTPVAPRWRSQRQHHNHVQFELDTPQGFMCVYVDPNRPEPTPMGYLTRPEAQSLATWILDHLRGVPK